MCSVAKHTFYSVSTQFTCFYLPGEQRTKLQGGK